MKPFVRSAAQQESIAFRAAITSFAFANHEHSGASPRFPSSVYLRFVRRMVKPIDSSGPSRSPPSPFAFVRTTRWRTIHPKDEKSKTTCERKSYRFPCLVDCIASTNETRRRTAPCFHGQLKPDFERVCHSKESRVRGKQVVRLSATGLRRTARHRAAPAFVSALTRPSS